MQVSWPISYSSIRSTQTISIGKEKHQFMLQSQNSPKLRFNTLLPQSKSSTWISHQDTKSKLLCTTQQGKTLRMLSHFYSSNQQSMCSFATMTFRLRVRLVWLTHTTTECWGSVNDSSFEVISSLNNSQWKLADTSKDRCLHLKSNNEPTVDSLSRCNRGRQKVL